MTEDIPDADVLRELERRQQSALLRSIARDSATIERERVAQALERSGWVEQAAFVRALPEREGL